MAQEPPLKLPKHPLAEAVKGRTEGANLRERTKRLWSHVPRPVRDFVYFYLVEFLWRAVRDAVRLAFRHLGKEICVAVLVLVVAYATHQKKQLGGLGGSFVVLLEAAGIWLGLLFASQLVMAPVRAVRKRDEKLERQGRDFTTYLVYTARLRRKHPATGVFAEEPADELARISLIFGTELRDVLRKIEHAWKEKPRKLDPLLPAFAWRDFGPTLAKWPEHYRLVDAAYTACQTANVEGPLPSNLKDAYDKTKAALDGLGEPHGERYQTEADRIARALIEEAIKLYERGESAG